MSLIARSRLMRDSARSPNVAAMATTSPSRTAFTRPPSLKIPGPKSTNAVTNADEATTVTSVAPIRPSSDFFGLVAGASGRWIAEPPHTEPMRNAAVSKMKASPITATTICVSNVVKMIRSEPASAGIQTHPEQGQPDVADRVLAMGSRDRHEPQERGQETEREHRHESGLGVEVGPGQHQGATHQSHGGRWLAMVLHHHPVQLTLRDEGHDGSDDGEDSVTDQERDERDARENDAGQERRGHVPVGSVAVEVGPDLDGCGLLPAGSPETLGADDDRP